MSRREDFANTIHHRQPSRLTLDLGGCPLSSLSGGAMDNLLDCLGFHREHDHEGDVETVDERILQALGIDTRGVGTILSPEKSQYQKLSDTEFIDAWGIRRRWTGLYWDIVGNPLKGATPADLDEYHWPDADSINLRQVEAIGERAKYLYEHTDYVVCASHPVFGVFELGCWMCGFDEFLMKMAIDQDFVRKFFDIVLEYQKKAIELYYTVVGPYIHYTSSGDDFATQANTFMSPAMFRELVKPYYAERVNHTKKYTAAAYLHHSCGNVSRLIPDLVDCGIQILNPIQPVTEAMQPVRLKEDFGSAICFHGGIDTQRLLPFGSEEEIKTSVRETAGTLARGGGYIFAAAHNLQDDVPAESILTMFEAARAITFTADEPHSQPKG